MKIAIASEGKTQDSEVSLSGGRAPYYFIYEDKKMKELIENPFAEERGGTGFSVADLLAKKKIDLVILGQIGENMKYALEKKGIKYKEAAGKKIKEVI